MIAFAFAAVSGAADAAETALDGRASVRGLYSFDDGPGNPTTGIGFVETDIRGRDLTESGLQLQLDATFLLDATQSDERRFGNTETLDQVRQFYATQPNLLGLDVSAGRRIVFDAGNAWVDGADVKWRANETFGLGIYGGLSPDRFDHAFGTRYQGGGIYATVQTDELNGSLAYNALLRETALDRQYVFNRLHYRVLAGLFVASYLVFDFVDEPQVTTVLGTVDYTPVRALNLTLNVSRYSLDQYRNESIYHNVIEPNQALLLGDEVLRAVYNRVRFSASVRFWGRYYHYQSVESKRRQNDDGDAWFLTFGLRNDHLLGLGTTMDLSASLKNNFESDSYQIALEIEHPFGATWTSAARASLFNGRTLGRNTERGRTFDEAQEIWLFGTTVFWRPTRQHQASLDYDGVYEAELQDAKNQAPIFIHTVMTRYSFYF